MFAKCRNFSSGNSRFSVLNFYKDLLGTSHATDQNEASLRVENQPIYKLRMPGNPILTCYEKYNCSGEAIVLTDYASDLSRYNFNDRIASCNYIEM